MLIHKFWVTVWISSATRDLLLIQQNKEQVLLNKQQIWCGGAYPVDKFHLASPLGISVNSWPVIMQRGLFSYSGWTKEKTTVLVLHDAQLLLNKQQQIWGGVYIQW